MSIITTKHKYILTPAEKAALKILQSSEHLATSIVADWEKGFDRIWNNPVSAPEEVLEALGTNAVEVFELSSKLLGFLAQVLPGRNDAEWDRIRTKLATSMKPYTPHPDGTVTLNV